MCCGHNYRRWTGKFLRTSEHSLPKAQLLKHLKGKISSCGKEEVLGFYFYFFSPGLPWGSRCFPCHCYVWRKGTWQLSLTRVTRNISVRGNALTTPPPPPFYFFFVWMISAQWLRCSPQEELQRCSPDEELRRCFPEGTREKALVCSIKTLC